MRNAPYLIAALALATVPATVSAAEPVTGRWLTDDGKAVVTIGTCGTTVCGKITKILAVTPKGPPVDEYNPDPKLRHRPIEGLQILSGFKPNGNSWKGRIYSPEEGKTYKSVMTRAGEDRIKVKGCVLFFCKTQTWSKAK